MIKNPFLHNPLKRKEQIEIMFNRIKERYDYLCQKYLDELYRKVDGIDEIKKVLIQMYQQLDQLSIAFSTPKL